MTAQIKRNFFNVWNRRQKFIGLSYNSYNVAWYENLYNTGVTLTGTMDKIY